MNLIPMICALVGCLCMAVLVCIVKSDKLILLFNILGNSFLIGLAITTINYRNAFNAFSILVIISILPLFLTFFNFDIFKEKENSNKEENSNSKNKTLTDLINGLGFLLSSICLSVAVLYIGLETYLIALLGFFVGLMLTFLYIIIKKIFKNKEKISFLSQFFNILLCFLSAGLFISISISAMVYSLDLKNILFSIGSILIAINIILNKYLNNKYISLVFYAGIILIISCFIV